VSENAGIETSFEDPTEMTVAVAVLSRMLELARDERFGDFPK
jgi:hypothetical protein